VISVLWNFLGQDGGSESFHKCHHYKNRNFHKRHSGSILLCSSLFGGKGIIEHNWFCA